MPKCDCCGICCYFTTVILVIYADVVLCVGFFPHWTFSWKWGHILVFNAVCVLALLSHFFAAITDPGTVTKISGGVPLAVLFQLAKIVPGLKRCAKCDGPKPPRAHHCSVCERCVMKMDHHCPWVNNCVGIGNQKQFLLFLLYISVLCGYSLGALAFSVMACSSINPDMYYNMPEYPYSNSINVSNHEIVQVPSSQRQILPLTVPKLREQSGNFGDASFPVGRRLRVNDRLDNSAAYGHGERHSTDVTVQLVAGQLSAPNGFETQPLGHNEDVHGNDVENPMMPGVGNMTFTADDNSDKLSNKLYDNEQRKANRGLYPMRSCEVEIDPILIVAGALLFIEAVIFGLFSSVMLIDQLHSILTDTSGIDNMQHASISYKRNRNTPKLLSHPLPRDLYIPKKLFLLKEVFGQNFSWRWLIPTRVYHLRDKKVWERAYDKEKEDSIDGLLDSDFLKRPVDFTDFGVAELEQLVEKLKTCSSCLRGTNTELPRVLGGASVGDDDSRLLGLEEGDGSAVISINPQRIWRYKGVEFASFVANNTVGDVWTGLANGNSGGDVSFSNNSIAPLTSQQARNRRVGIPTSASITSSRLTALPESSFNDGVTSPSIQPPTPAHSSHNNYHHHRDMNNASSDVTAPDHIQSQISAPPVSVQVDLSGVPPSAPSSIHSQLLPANLSALPSPTNPLNFNEAVNKVQSAKHEQSVEMPSRGHLTNRVTETSEEPASSINSDYSASSLLSFDVSVAIP